MPQECAEDAYNELEPTEANATTVYAISLILEKLGEWDKLDEKTSQTVWRLYDKILHVEEQHFVAGNDMHMASTERFLTSLDRFMRKSEEPVKFLNGTNIALMKKTKADNDTTNSSGNVGIVDYGTHFGDIEDDQEESDGHQLLASIEVPAEWIWAEEEDEEPKPTVENSQQLKKGMHLLAAESKTENEDGGNKGIYFALYRRAHFFLGNSTQPSNADFGTPPLRTDRCKRTMFTRPDGIVLSATVLSNNKDTSYNAQNPRKMATIRYRKRPFSDLHGDYMITWWNEAESRWAGREQADGCKMRQDGDIIEAECYHLTDFTLLVDGLQTDPMLCDRFTMALGMVLNMSSFLALLLLNAIYVIYRSPVLYHRVFIEYLHDHLPRLQLDQQALYYNVTLMCFYLLFAAFSDQQHVGGSSVVCRVVAMLNYWLLMCCILLTIFQAWRILKMFIWTVALERAIIVATRKEVMLAVSFGVPALLCAIFGLTINDFFYRDDEFCWIRPNYVWFAVVLPLSLLLLNGAICAVIIGLRLFPNSCGMKQVLERHASATIRLSKGARRKSRNKLAVLMMMQFSLGLPWVLQFVTLSIPHISLSHILFTLVNGSQGLILLTLFGYRQIQMWRTQRNSRRPAAVDDGKVASTSSGIFTNSIGMRIPIGGGCVSSDSNEKNKEEVEGKTATTKTMAMMKNNEGPPSKSRRQRVSGDEKKY